MKKNNLFLSFNDIKKNLKQKSPFLFIDRVLELDPGKKITAVKNISGSELFVSLHFPDYAVYPGIFIIESVAQASALLLGYPEEENKEHYMVLGGIQQFQFLKPVTPGDVLRIEAETVAAIDGKAVVKALVFSGEDLAAKGQLSFGVMSSG